MRRLRRLRRLVALRSYARHTKKGGREARSAIGSRCMQTVGRVRHLALANDGVVVVTVTVHFLR